MPDEKTKEEIHKEKVEEFKKKVDKEEKIDKRELIDLVATRELLERDYKEDTLEVIFSSSPSTRRKIISHKPTPEQMTKMMRLNAEALIYETKPTNPKIVEELTSVYDKFAELAANLTIDKKLDKEFWNTKVTTYALNSFINELMTVVIQGPLSESELSKFR